MAEAPENGKESSHSAYEYANGINKLKHLPPLSLPQSHSPTVLFVQYFFFSHGPLKYWNVLQFGKVMYSSCSFKNWPQKWRLPCCCCPYPWSRKKTLVCIRWLLRNEYTVFEFYSRCLPRTGWETQDIYYPSKCKKCEALRKVCLTVLL